MSKIITVGSITIPKSNILYVKAYDNGEFAVHLITKGVIMLDSRQDYEQVVRELAE